jgi:hypothetical protein
MDDVQAHLGLMVEDLMAAMGGEPTRIYEVGLHANALLESMAEAVIAWQLLRQAEVALPEADDSPFHEGKVAIARFFVRDIAPGVAARRRATAEEDGSLMELSEEAF